MKTLMIVFVAAASLATVGCKKKAADAGAGSGSGSGSDTTMVGSAAAGSATAVASGGGDCTKAIANSMAVSKAKLGVDDTTAQKMTDLAVKHCTDDKWGPDATKCMTDAKTITEAQACYGKLTPDQMKTMNMAAQAAMTGSGSGSAAK